MKEKILACVLIGVMEAVFFTACATSGALFADCIQMKIRENLIKKEQKKQKEKGND